MDRQTLLRIVKENKEKHIKAYLESVEDYKVAVIKVSQSNFKMAKTGLLEEFKFKAMPLMPTSYEGNYTKAIRMLELSIDATIDVEEHIFNQLVLDEWGWKQQFTALSTSYKTI
jgi:hypothetical protein